MNKISSKKIQCVFLPAVLLLFRYYISRTQVSSSEKEGLHLHKVLGRGAEAKNKATKKAVVVDRVFYIVYNAVERQGTKHQGIEQKMDYDGRFFVLTTC